MSSKKDLRKSLKALRNSLSDSKKIEASKRACEKVAMLGLDCENCNILLYHPFASEMDPLYLMQHLKGNFYLPKISYSDKSMEFYSYKADDVLVEHSLGMKEVSAHGTALVPKEKDIIILPSLGLDLEGHRLGYGGGFYDRYLERYKGLIKVGITYEELLQKNALPVEEHDILMDYVITEKRIIIEDLRHF